MNYYNEHDKKAAAWLRELIAAGLIVSGDVDERSIVDVRPADLTGYTQCHFFAGIGGWSYALQLAGWPDDRPVWTGSCPCQPFSAAGKGQGAADARHLWPEWFRLIRECRPATIFGEQVEGAVRHGWWDAVQRDLEGEGYACGMAVLGAHSVGAPHIRQRVYFVGKSEGERQQKSGGQSRPTFEPSSAISFVAESTSGGRWQKPGGSQILSPEEQHWRASGRQPGSCRKNGELAVTNGGDSSTEGLQRSGEYRQQQEDGGTGCAVVNAESEQAGLPGCSRESGSPGPLGNTNEPRSQGRRLNAREYSDQFTVGAPSELNPCGVGVTNNTRSQPGDEPTKATRHRDTVDTTSFWSHADWLPCIDGKARPVEPGTFPLAYGIPGRVGRLRGYGNAIVPQVAAEFIKAFGAQP